ncbi:hypothetical protein F511_34518 [Dorcoceras hygrometricum]|uniref:Uncharacterized protein n=1 Tax=Dorcoceras hygrometricum TaxID=472368 RepID=A0A2Z7B7E2_9LAMI|nr:hypothetical protein F511_34518 [Dorcoceras hygrometricum]
MHHEVNQMTPLSLAFYAVLRDSMKLKWYSHSLISVRVSSSEFECRRAILGPVNKDFEKGIEAAVDPPIRSTTGNVIPPSICTRRYDGFWHERKLLVKLIGTSPITARGGGGRRPAAALGEAGGGVGYWEEGRPNYRKSHSLNPPPMLNTLSSVFMRTDGFIITPIDDQIGPIDSVSKTEHHDADTASRGPTTIVAPKSQFWTCPSDHGKAPSNIAP